MKKYLVLIGSLFLAACNSGFLGNGATQDSISLTTTTGNCADGMTNAPYCMAITINNNASGQNYINSTNYPISGISVTTSGVSNVISPMNNSSTMDPNGCTSATIKPGGSCTFYVAITSEAYKVSTHQPINVSINYTINDSLFVNGDHTGSNNLTIYENTNLYTLNNIGTLWTYNAQGLSLPVSAESANAGIVLSSTIDTFQTGKLILSNSSNIWSYGLGNVSSSIVNISGLTGANVMLSLSSGLYVSSANSGSFYNAVESSGAFTWASKLTLSQQLAPNAFALNSTNGLYVANINSGQVQNCSGVFSGTASCASEAVPLSSNINALAYAGTLYAGTSGSSGVYYENGTGSTATWSSVVNLASGAINMMKTSSNGYVIVTDDANNLWRIATSATSATNVASNLPSSVNAFAIDNFASSPNVYFVANNGLYSCGSGGFMSCSPTLLATGISGTALNLLIGSSLSTN